MPNIDAIVYWPPTNKAYFFRGSNYVRYRLGGGEGAEEKISLTEHRWRNLAFEDRIDAATTVGTERLVYFFRDDLFVAYQIADRPEDETALHQPIAIASRFPDLPPKYQRDLDAVLYWPTNRRLYFFKGGAYLACNPGRGTPLQQERALPGGWRNLPFDRIDAAFVGKQGKGYFFRGEEYIVYSVSEDRAVETARPWKDHWPLKRSSPSEKTLWELVSDSGDLPPSRPPHRGTTPSSTTKRMDVGFNYPWAWNQFGFYFGAGKPPGTDPRYDRWTVDLQTNLRILRDELNIRHVRIFLLCNAWNYGDIISDPPPTVPLVGTPIHTTGRDKLTLPRSLDPRFTDHLNKMLNVFKSEDMFVLPSILDHRCFRPRSLSNGAGGRAALISDPSLRSRFLMDVLGPFLKVSLPHASVIYAWEVVSEPIWNVNVVFGAAHAYYKHGNAFAPNADVSETDMKDFIDRAVTQIDGLKFDSTVGHRYYSDLSSLPTGKIRQFHYYPKSYAVPTLPGMPPIQGQLPYTDPNPLPTFAESNAIVGEFSCKLPGPESDAWPELNGADTRDVTTAVHERLRLLNRKGYRLAFVWSDLDGSPFPGICRLKLSSDAQAGIKKYMASP